VSKLEKIRSSKTNGPRPVPQAPLKIVSTVDALAKALGDRVLNADFRPGDPIREVQIAREYGVGRHTVRAACSRLAHEGLLRREPNRGMFVPLLSGDDVRDLYWLRSCLEIPIFARLAENAEVPPEAEERLRQFEALPPSAPWSEVVEADFSFHRALINAVGIERLSQMYESLTWEVSLAIAQLQPRYSSTYDLAREHRTLLEALDSGDSTIATAAIREHLDTGLADILDATTKRRRKN
jgi:DNA-binding GntR family transcriptional regulator